jgi:hypothetical protein
MIRALDLTLALAAVVLLAAAAVAFPVTASGADSDGDSDMDSCRLSIARLLQAPTSSNFAAFQRDNLDGCWSRVAMEQLQEFDKLVAGGNRPAARFLAQHVRQLDGGELEDALRAFGQFASHHMADFLALSAAGALTERQATNALTMLPLDLDDNFTAQIAALRARRIRLEHVRDPNVQTLKRAAIASIDQFIQEIQRAQSAAGAPQPHGQ